MEGGARGEDAQLGHPPARRGLGDGRCGGGIRHRNMRLQSHRSKLRLPYGDVYPLQRCGAGYRRAGSIEETNEG